MLPVCWRRQGGHASSLLETPGRTCFQSAGDAREGHASTRARGSFETGRRASLSSARTVSAPQHLDSSLTN
eukprot:4707800-Prymnesium_polylepis.1